MKFKDLGLSAKVLSAVETAGYETPTPIQEKAIPVALQGRDVLGIAQTGTGKTASFTLPMLTRLETGRARARMPRSLILEPTRELAAQVEQSFLTYGAQHKLTMALLIGGVSFADQDRKLDRGADVLIATPGRLLDHFERGKLMLNGVEVLVIDEADRMLDMGFIPDIERICKLIPFTRQTLFFSATMPPEIQRLTEAFLQNPERIEVAPPSSTSATIDQKLAFSGKEPHQKRETLRGLIRSQEVKNAIVFCNRKRDVGIVARSLEKHGFRAGALHGDMDQHARMATLDGFKNGNLDILVASDVAARGLDIPNVGHVFNFDVPVHAEDYVHRIGRTGRAGREGHSITIVTSSEMKSLSAIEGLIKKDIEWLGGAPGENDLARDEKPGRRRRGGKDAKADTSRTEKKSTSRKSADADSSTRTSGDAEKKAQENSKPEAEPDTAKPKKAATRKRSSKAESNDNDELETLAFGRGGHVPAFLQRPVRIAS